MARVIEVIETEDRRGIGNEADPVRMVKQFWSRDGELLMERDPCDPLVRDAIALARFIQQHPHAARGAGDDPHRAFCEQQRMAEDLLERHGHGH